MSLRKPSSTKPLPPSQAPAFFTDRDLGNAVAVALENAGFTAYRHDAVFSNTKTRDEVWLERVGREGWLGLSRNKEIQRIRSERDAAMVAGAGVFFLIGKLPHAQLAKNVIATLPAIIKFWHTHPRPFTAKIYRPDGGPEALGAKPGKVELWMDKAGWAAAREESDRRRNLA